MKKQISTLLILAYTSASIAASPCKNISNRVQLISVGDIIFHGALHTQALTEKKGFESLWTPVQSILDQADIIYANLEGPSAPLVHSSGKVIDSDSGEYNPTNDIYSVHREGKSFSFNFHPKSIEALKKSGFELLSTANNHTLDRKAIGVDKSFDFLESQNIQHFGTSKNGNRNDFYSIVDKNNIRMAFIACTYGTNGGSRMENKISYCFLNGKSHPALLEQIADLSQKVDLVILTPHWGTEYQSAPNALQKQLAKDALRAGARVILGAHPHHVQPTQVITQGEKVQSIIAYSLGNFVTNQMPNNFNDLQRQQNQFPQRFGQMLTLSIEKMNGEIILNPPKSIPLYMTPRSENAKNMRQVIVSYPEITQGSKTLINNVTKSLEIAKSILGEDQLLDSSKVESVFSDYCN